RQRLLDDVNCAAVVDLVIQAAALRPQVGVGGQVIDLAAAAHGRGDGGPVADVAADHVEPVERQVSCRHPRQLQDANVLAPFHEAADEMAADEASAAGDQNGL